MSFQCQESLLTGALKLQQEHASELTLPPHIPLLCRQLFTSFSPDPHPVLFPFRITALPSGVLQIYNVQRKDAGNYRCVATTVAIRRKSAEAALTVLPGTLTPPRWVRWPSTCPCHCLGAEDACCALWVAWAFLPHQPLRRVVLSALPLSVASSVSPSSFSLARKVFPQASHCSRATERDGLPSPDGCL